MSAFTLFFILYLIFIIPFFGVLAWSTFRRKPRAALPVAQDSRKYCRDCQYCLPAPTGLMYRRRDYEFARCAHITSVREPANILVTGQLSEDNMMYCSIARKVQYTLSGITLQFLPPPEGSEGMSLCGPDGRYWERRPT